MSDIKQFVQDRNAALLSLDKDIILAFADKYGVPLIGRSDETVFWAAVHKARCEVVSFPDSVREESREWLLSHGFRPLTG